jgi:hypothetical protein
MATQPLQQHMFNQLWQWLVQFMACSSYCAHFAA